MPRFSALRSVVQRPAHTSRSPPREECSTFAIRASRREGTRSLALPRQRGGSLATGDPAENETVVAGDNLALTTRGRYSQEIRICCLAVAVLLSSCASFGSSGTADNPADAGPSDDGGKTSDAAPDAGPLSGIIVTFTQETERTLAVAADRTNVYWWSQRDARIRKASKAKPNELGEVAARPGQAVSVLATDANGFFWLETGPEDGGTTHRVMTLDAGAPRALYRSTAALQRLALDGARVYTVEGNNIVSVSRPTGPGQIELSTFADGQSLASNGIDLFFTFSGRAIFRLSNGTPTKMIDDLGGPRELAAAGANLYAVVPSGAGSAIISMSKTAEGLAADAAPPVVTTPPGRISLASEGAGVVWANAADGTIQRIAKLGAATTLVASGIGGANAIAADSDGVYWTADDGTVAWARR